MTVDRIDGDDRGQQRRSGLPAGDQVAGIDAPVRDASRERRAHLRPFEVELGRLEIGLGALLRADRAVEVGAALVDVARRDGAVLRQALGALDLVLRELDLGLGARDLGAGDIDGQPVGALVDREQQVALLHQGAVAEMQGVEETRDARPNLDLLARLEAAGILVPVGDALGQRRRDLHRRGGRRSLGEDPLRRQDERG